MRLTYESADSYVSYVNAAYAAANAFPSIAGPVTSLNQAAGPPSEAESEASSASLPASSGFLQSILPAWSKELSAIEKNLHAWGKNNEKKARALVLASADAPAGGHTLVARAAPLAWYELEFELDWARPRGAFQIGQYDRRGRAANKPALPKREANATPVRFRDELLRLARHAGG